jgi:hypothetical protein
MRILRKVTIEKEETEDILCNMCGESCKEGKYGDSQWSQYQGLIEVDISAGYDSKVLNDGDEYIFSLCEKCLKELMDKFKFDAYIGNSIGGEVNKNFKKETQNV